MALPCSAWVKSQRERNTGIFTAEHAEVRRGRREAGNRIGFLVFDRAANSLS